MQNAAKKCPCYKLDFHCLLETDFHDAIALMFLHLQCLISLAHKASFPQCSLEQSNAQIKHVSIIIDIMT